MALDEDLSLGVLQDVGPSQVGLYPPSVLKAYSRCGRTMAQYSAITGVLDSSQKDLSTIALLYSQSLCSGLMR